MSTVDIISKYEQLPKISQIAALLGARKKTNITGLVGSSLSFVIHALFKKTELPLLLLFNDKKEHLGY